MNYTNQKEHYSVVDLESGDTKRTSKEDESPEIGSGGNLSEKILVRNRNEIEQTDYGGLTRSSDGLGSSKVMPCLDENLEILVDKEGGKAASFVESKIREKQKRMSSKKPPKPPRPPRAPPLNGTDIKLVKESSELAKLRHARIERMKAVKKMRAEKASSPAINMLAMAITTLFCFVIIFHGILGSHA